MSSCVKDVILDAGDRTVVVECVLCDTPGQELRLAFSQGASESAAEELTEAVARLIDLTESQTVGEFKRDADGIWRLDYTAVPLHKYRLEVEVPGFDLIYAEDTMPDAMQFLRDEDTISTGRYSAWKIVPYGTSPSERVRVHPASTADTHFSHLDYLYSINNPNPNVLGRHIWVYGMKPNPVTGEYELADKICGYFGSATYVDDFNVLDEVYEAPMIPTRYPFRYGEESFPTYLTFGSTVNGQPLHKRFLRIETNSDFLSVDVWCSIFDMENIEKEFTELANTEYTFSDNDLRLLSLFDNLTEIDCVIMDQYEPSFTEGYIVFKSVSDNYNKYFEEAMFQLRRQNKESTDMSEMSIYMRENIYSNVKGGAGIFATSTQQTEPMQIYPTVYFDVP
jgi:hypothetical protein